METGYIRKYNYTILLASLQSATVLSVGVVLNKTLSRTEAIYTHGLHLASTVDPYTLPKQVGF